MLDNKKEYCEKRYTEEETKWLVDNANNYNYKDLTKQYNKAFENRIRAETAIIAKVKRLKINNDKIKQKKKRYTKEEDKWLSQNFGNKQYSEITKLFNRKFNSNRTVRAIQVRIRDIRQLKNEVQNLSKHEKQRKLEVESLKTSIKKGRTTLCWLCDKAGIECGYHNGTKPVKNWVATESKLNFRGKYGNEETVSHCVHKCPNYYGCLSKGYDEKKRKERLVK